MAWDFSTLYGEIQAEVDDDGEDLDVIKQLTNDICRIIWNAEQWRFRQFTDTISTVAGTRTYNLETELGYAVHQISSVGYKGSSDTIFQILKEAIEAEMEGVDVTTQGRPYRWLFDGTTLTLQPNPDYTGTDNIQIRGEKLWVELVDDGDDPLIPEKYKHVIKAGVKWYFYDFDDDIRAETERRKFEGIRPGEGGGLGEMRAAELDSTTSQKKGQIASHGRRR